MFLKDGHMNYTTSTVPLKVKSPISRMLRACVLHMYTCACTQGGLGLFIMLELDP